MDRGKEWKDGYRQGCAETRARIWGAVYDYVFSHDPDKARQLRDAVGDLTQAHDREKSWSD